jgi:O-antigen/teichoic acid export membrane protein
VLKTSVVLVLIQLLIALTGYVLRVFLSREIGKDLFGEFTFALALGTWASLFIQGGLEKTLIREFIRNKESRCTTFTSSLILKLVLALPTTLCVVGILNTTSTHIYAFQGLLTLSMATAIKAFNTQPVYDSESQQTTYSLISLGERIVLLATVFLTCFFNSTLSLSSLSYIYLLVLISSLIAQYLLVPFSPKVIPLKPIPNSISTLIQNSWLIWLATIAGAAVEYSSPLLLRYFSGPSEVADFGVCWLLIMLLVLAQRQSSRVGYVRLLKAHQQSPAATYRTWKKYCCWMLLFGLLVALPGLTYPQNLLSLFGTEYQSASQILRILSLYPIVFGPFLASLQYILTLNWNRAYLAINLLTGVSSLLGHVLITREYASSGAATVSVLSLFIGLSAVTTLIYVYRPNEKTVSKADDIKI